MLKKNGFTMLELLIVLIIMSMITVMSIPAFSSHIRGSRLRTAAREISSAVMSARTQAITLREYRTVFFQETAGGKFEFRIAGDEEGWFLPIGVRFDGSPSDIVLTPMGRVSEGAGNIIIFSDENGDGNWDGESFTDTNNNGVWDDNELFDDTNNNNTWDGEARRGIRIGVLGHVDIN